MTKLGDHGPPHGAATAALSAQALAPRHDLFTRGGEVAGTRNIRRRGDRWPKPVPTVKAGRPLCGPFAGHR
jgi:hypothetical protein